MKATPATKSKPAPKKTFKNFKRMTKVVKAGFDIAKEAKLIKDQQAFETLSMSALRAATKSIQLMKKADPGRTLPVFSGSNRKVVIPTVSTGTVSTSVYGYKFRETGVKRNVGDTSIVVRKNAQLTAISTVNQQGVADVPLLSCSKLTSGGPFNYTINTYEEAFESVFNVAGQDPTVPLNPSARDQNRIAVDRFETEIKIVNPDSNGGPVEVTIYDLLPKRDVPKGTFVDRLTALGLQSPGNTWNTGLSNSVMLNDTVNYNVLGVIPTNDLKFNSFWQVMKRTKVELSAGSTHIHRGCNELNTLFNYYDYSEVLGLRAGLCPYAMLVWNGLPNSTDTAAPVTINWAVTTALYARSAVNNNITVRNYDSSIT